MIHIAFCINDNFVMPCNVCAFSIIKNTQEPVTFHIVFSTLSSQSISKLKDFSSKYNIIFIFHDISSFDFSDLIIRNGDRVTQETYFRFILPSILPDISKLIYIDADMLCINDIATINNINISDYAVGMVYDQCYSQISYFNRLDYDFSYGYFNAGFMYINLDFWRKNNISSLLFEYVTNNPEKCICHDQDAINAKLHKYILPLSPSFNFQHAFFKVFAWLNPQKYGRKYLNSDTIEKSKWNEILGAAHKPIIIHYSCPSKPWHKDSTAPFTDLWRIYYKELYNKDFKPISRYSSKFKRFKILVHIILSKLHIMKPIIYPTYPEEAKQIEKEYILKYEKK